MAEPMVGAISSATRTSTSSTTTPASFAYDIGSARYVLIVASGVGVGSLTNVSLGSVSLGPLDLFAYYSTISGLGAKIVDLADYPTVPSSGTAVFTGTSANRQGSYAVIPLGGLGVARASQTTGTSAGTVGPFTIAAGARLLTLVNSINITSGLTATGVGELLFTLHAGGNYTGFALYVNRTGSASFSTTTGGVAAIPIDVSPVFEQFWPRGGNVFAT